MKKKLRAWIFFYFILFCILPVFAFLAAQFLMTREAFTQIHREDIDHSIQTIKYYLEQRSLEALNLYKERSALTRV